MSAAITILVGPPCSGKSSRDLPAGASRLDATGKTLHAIDKMIRRHLDKKPGEPAVVDQPFSANSVLLKLKEFSRGIVHCEPQGGYLQMVWANEFAMAEMAQSNGEAWRNRNPPICSYLPVAHTAAAASLVYPSHWQRAIAPWDSNTGSSSSAVKLPLAPTLGGDFLTRGLVVDGECILEHNPSDALAPTPGAAESLKAWLQDKGGPSSCRLIVLLHPTRLFQKRSQDEDENERFIIKDCDRLKDAAIDGLRALCKLLPPGTHLYYVWVGLYAPPEKRDSQEELQTKEAPPLEATAWLACAPPGGVSRKDKVRSDGRLTSSALVWAIRRHRLDLRELTYVCSEGDHHCMLAHDSHLKCIQSKDFLRTKGRPPPSASKALPHFLQPFATTSKGDERTQKAQQAELPLLLDGRKCNASDGTPEPEVCFGREHGVIESSAPSLPGLTATAAAVPEAAPTAAALPPPPQVPSTQSRFRVVDDSEDEESPEDASIGGSGLGFDERDILELAGNVQTRINDGQQLRSLRRLSDLEIKRLEEGGDGHSLPHLRLRAKCAGSTQNNGGSAEIYSVEVRIARPPHPLLLSRSCDCVHYTGTICKTSAAEEGGRRLCKHQIALMLEALKGPIPATAPASTAAAAASSSSSSRAPPPPQPRQPPPRAPAAAAAAAPRVARQLPSFAPDAGMKKRKERQQQPAAMEATDAAPAAASSSSSAAASSSTAAAPAPSRPAKQPRVDSSAASTRPIVMPSRPVTAEDIHRIAKGTLWESGQLVFPAPKAAAAASAAAAAPAVPAGPPFARPRGQAPKGANGQPKKWNADTGEWEEVAAVAPPPSEAPPQPPTLAPTDETPPRQAAPAAEPPAAAVEAPAAAPPPPPPPAKKSFMDDLMEDW